MNLTSLPRATLWTIGALVAALIGWGALVYSNASHRNAAAEWASERAALDGRVAALTGSEAGLPAAGRGAGGHARARSAP